MTQFTEPLWCPRCKKFTPHRVHFLNVWGDPPEMYVHFAHRCLRILAVTGKGKTRKTILCSFSRDDVVTVRDYNALVKMAKEDFPADFTTGADNETD